MAKNKKNLEEHVELEYSQGGLLFNNWNAKKFDCPFGMVFDTRTQQHRAPAYQYREFILFMIKNSIEYTDKARRYDTCSLSLRKKIIPRLHQKNALDSWLKAKNKGLVSLPTGAGKTILALMIMEKISRSTLIVVPTIDLLQQWKKVLEEFFSCPIGAIGGGQKSREAVTVITYDSAALMIEQFGSNFGLLIFDECHHLPAPQYQKIAYSSLAPYRLGLSATIERQDGGEAVLYDLIGDCVYTGHIDEMADNVLAPYDVICLGVSLSEEERKAYDAARSCYLNFVRQQKINFSQADGWKQFIMRASRSIEGKKAFRAYREQKHLAQAASGKLEEVWKLINSHSGEPMIIFTDDNALAYKIGREFILPVLTHKTKTKERKKLLDGFRSSSIRVLVTSKVLNEGVDVPEARIGVVVSGSGAVREHVQRLGRILRHYPGKRAVLYEIVALDTNEQSVNERRRQHHAYQRST